MKQFLFFLTGVLLSITFYSCNPEETESANPNKYVNDWIAENMETYYYWKDKLPSRTDKTLAPDAYFESLLYKYQPVTAPDGDRFSWIQDSYVDLLSSLNGVESYEIGFDYVLFLKEEGSANVVGQVTYVKKGTPAESAGIKRGMMFDRLNGTVLTVSNYKNLLSAAASQVTYGFLKEIYASDGSFIDFSADQNLTIQTVSNYEENPVYLDSVYTFQNRKVGYLVYHFFAADHGDGSAEYNLQLNRVFGKFKRAGITDLVLDLRYNSGGLSSSAALLASEIVPDLSKDNIFCYYQYNATLNEYYKNKYGSKVFNTYFTESVVKGSTNLELVNNVGNNLSSRVVVLTGPYTASASEQVINSLKPYMNQVVLIGDTTYGKNVASFSLYEEKEARNKWGMQPIVAKYFNKDGQSDFTAGFVPDYKVDDVGMPGIKPLGDVNENLLNKALVVLGIFNNSNAVQERSRMIQNSKLLRPDTHAIRGLQLDKLPFFK